MAEKPYRALFYLSKTMLTKTCNELYSLKKGKNSHSYQSQNHKHPFQESLLDQTLMFHVEGALLKSTSVFPYFMIVAFEAGGLLRALILLLLYAFICLVSHELGLKIMTFVCFVGIKEESFRIGRSVLPKFFLEDVGNEGFDMVMRCGRKVGVSDLPEVMVDGFLRDYLGVEAVVARELKVVCGYFVGLMEEKKACGVVLNEIFRKEKIGSHVVGIGCFNKCLDQLFSRCQVVHFVSEAEKRNWQILPRKKYPRPLIFHDGRLAFKPTPLATLVMFIWVPLGLFLFIVRLIVVLSLPYKLSIPILCFIGMGGTLSRPNSFTNLDNTEEEKSRGILYVCNHRTLVDPIYVSIALMKPLTAVTYSLSRVSEVLSPIKTVRLTRNREKDFETIERILSQGHDLVICPEGTTCREPYLLRFSPLFGEMISDDIVPIAIDFHVGMFYGTTASGFKCLDPIFLLMNPMVTCSITILDKLPESLAGKGGGKSKFEVANHVQAQIANALEFECTCLTRKDKYMILAGNEGNM